MKIFAVEGPAHRRSPSIGEPEPRRGATVAEPEIAERTDGQLAGGANTTGGGFNVASSPGHGTVLTISLPWPALAVGRR